MKKRIYYTKPSISEHEVDYATDAARNGWGSQCYDYLNRFEAQFKAHLGVKHALATSSCTGALHMGLSALGIGPGDEVIMADTNWIATASPIIHLGAKPVFIDITEDTWCLNGQLIAAAITPRTKAIIAVHLYGNLCEMKQLLALGEQYRLPIIEDAAEAIGSSYHGKRAGSMGKFGAFSFHGTKTLTTGEGGIFVTNDDALYERVLTLSSHGRSSTQSKQFWADTVGFKYKMSNIQAAIGCAQIERIDELITRKREILAYYRQQLSAIEGIKINPEPENIINGAWMPTIVFDKKMSITREMLLRLFAEENIDARVFFWPLSAMPMFDAVKNNTNAWSIPNRAINLPSYHDMTLEDMERVAGVVKQVVDLSVKKNRSIEQ